MAVVPFWMPAKEMLQPLKPGTIRIDDEGSIDFRVLAFVSAAAPSGPSKEEDAVSIAIPKGVIDE